MRIDCFNNYLLLIELSNYMHRHNKKTRLDDNIRILSCRLFSSAYSDYIPIVSIGSFQRKYHVLIIE